MENNSHRRLAERVSHLEREVARLSAYLELSADEETDLESAEFLETEKVPSPEIAVTPESPPPLPGRLLTREEVWAAQMGYDAGHRPAEPRTVESRQDWRVALRQWHLWPPESDGNVEVQVGAWWATRLGALIAVIGIVFFGIYVAQGTPPWVRLVQLIGVAIGATAAGHWLERKIPRFGAVVFGGGLALLFFSGFAAYAVPAVKVIDTALVATLVQVILVGGIVACSLWKDRAVLATMAILLGFVTCFFSFFSNLPDISLVTSLVLSVAGVSLWLRRGWLPVFSISVPGAFLVYWVIATYSWGVAGAPVFLVALAHPVAAYLLFAGADFGTLMVGRKLLLRERRLLQGGNMGGAVGLSVLVTVRHFPNNLASVYFLFALLIGGAAFLYYRRNREDELAAIGFATAMGLLGLGWIEILGARTRWIALAVQSAIALVAARKTKLKTAEVSMFVLWGASLCLFLFDTSTAGIFVSRGAVWSLWGAAAAVYIATSLLLFSWHGRWMGRSREVSLGSGVALGIAATAAVYAGTIPEFFPAAAILAAVLLAGAGILLRHWVGAVAAVVLFAVGELAFIMAPRASEMSWSLWVNGAVAIGVGITVAAWLQLAVARGRIQGPGTILQQTIGALHVGWMIALQALVFKTATLEVNLLVAAALSIGLLVLAGRRRIAYLADLSLIPLLLAFGAQIWSGTGSSYLPESGNGWLLWLGAVGSFAAVCTRDCWSRLHENQRLFDDQWVVVLTGIVATIAGLFALEREFDPPALFALAGVAGVVVTLLVRWPGWSGGIYSGLAFLLFGHALSLGEQVSGFRGQDPWSAIGAAVILAGCAVAYVVLAGRAEFGVREKVVDKLQWGGSAVALGILFSFLISGSGAWSSYATVMWGLAAIGFFVAGLFWRTRPLRFVGLVGLGLCLPRIFLVDIHSTFYRIAAFVVVGLVLLLVGFLYHKYRHRIESVRETDVEESDAAN